MNQEMQFENKDMPMNQRTYVIIISFKTIRKGIAIWKIDG